MGDASPGVRPQFSLSTGHEPTAIPGVVPQACIGVTRMATESVSAGEWGNVFRHRNSGARKPAGPLRGPDHKAVAI